MPVSLEKIHSPNLLHKMESIWPLNLKQEEDWLRTYLRLLLKQCEKINPYDKHYVYLILDVNVKFPDLRFAIPQSKGTEFLEYHQSIKIWDDQKSEGSLGISPFLTEINSIIEDEAPPKNMEKMWRAVLARFFHRIPACSFLVSSKSIQELRTICRKNLYLRNENRQYISRFWQYKSILAANILFQSNGIFVWRKRYSDGEIDVDSHGSEILKGLQFSDIEKRLETMEKLEFARATRDIISASIAESVISSYESTESKQADMRTILRLCCHNKTKLTAEEAFVKVVNGTHPRSLINKIMENV